MIGGGGSIALRAAADVIGIGATGVCETGAAGGAKAGFSGAGTLGRMGAPKPMLGAGLGGGNGRSTARAVSAAPSVPRKSFTRVSTSWLIDTLLASQNAFSRSYVERLTLILRRVCFLAMVPLYATGSVSASRTY